MDKSLFMSSFDKHIKDLENQIKEEEDYIKESQEEIKDLKKELAEVTKEKLSFNPDTYKTETYIPPVEESFSKEELKNIRKASEIAITDHELKYHKELMGGNYYESGIRKPHYTFEMSGSVFGYIKYIRCDICKDNEIINIEPFLKGIKEQK